MLKIKKGLKKKIKGKKDKGKEDDLFDPEQLEKYRKELEEKRRVAAENNEEAEGTCAGSSASAAPHEQDEEWLKFKALTAGVDTILKKTTDDLATIKESSFYQRKSNDPTNLWKGDSQKVEAVVEEQLPEEPIHEGEVEQEHIEEEAEEFKVPESPEEPEVLDDSLFDTSYLDAIASGEIQLAYIPDSPTQEEGDDPFDTSGVADVVKRIEEAEKKAKRQVNLGSAVDVLSGKAGPTLETKARPRPGEAAKKGRARPRAVNLLGDFEGEGVAPTEPIFTSKTSASEGKTETTKDIFDELGSPVKDFELDSAIFAPSVCAVVPNKEVEKPKEKDTYQDILGEFDLIGQNEDKTESVSKNIPSVAILKSLLEPEPEDDEFEDEFAALAAESVHKGSSPYPPQEEEEDQEPEEEDPFDTTFVEKVAPELKLTTGEIVNKTDEEEDDDDFDFNPRVGESLAPGSVCPHPSPRSLLEDHSPTVENLPAIESHFKAPPPTGTLIESTVSNSEHKDIADPFDTTNVETVLGKSELKRLEEELLTSVDAPLQPKIPQFPINLSAPVPTAGFLEDDDDFDFDPRKDEVKKEPDHLFDIPHEEDLTGEVDISILTPKQEIIENEPDPFDTSIVSHLNLGPGHLELKLLESELVSGDPHYQALALAQQNLQNQNNNTTELTTLQRELSDPDFDPRGGEELDPFVVPVVGNTLLKTEDIFDHSEDFTKDKVLTPQLEANKPIVPESHGDFDDPFDTSSIEVLKLLPPSELKQIEGELLNAIIEPIPAPKPLPQIISTVPVQPQPSTEEFQQLVEEPPAPQLHLLEDDSFLSEIDHKPLTPLEIQSAYLDPFDTSIAEGVVPGKTEIRILEQELNLGVDSLSGRRLSDPDFDPRGGPILPQPIHPATLSFVSKTLEPTRVGDITQASADDPFDTSAADSVIVPIHIPQPPSGPTGIELKALEAELL